MAVGSRVWKQVLCRIFPHTSVQGEDWQKIALARTSSAGAAGGTTVISDGLASGAADTYNGKYWIEILSGTCKNQMKRIIDDNASGTLTVENNGFSAQIGSAVDTCLWLSPEPVVVVDGATGGAALSTTTLDDDYRDEADDYWNGFYLMPITGALRGEISAITDFDKEGGAEDGLFTFDAFTAAPVEGDVMLLGRFIEIEVPSLPEQFEYLPRPMSRVNYSIAMGSVGARGGEFAFNTRVYAAIGGRQNSGTIAAKSVLDPLFSAVGLETTAGTSSTIGAASTTTAVKIATGSWENHRVGQFVNYHGNLRRITALTDGGAGVDTVTVSPGFPLAPVSTQTLHGCRTYEKSLDATALYGCGIEIEIDGIRTIMTGCKGNLELVPGPVLEFSFTLSIDHWTIEYEDAPYNPGVAYTTRAQIQGRDMWAWLDTTQVDIKGFTAHVGREVAARAVSGKYGINGRAGFHHINYACGASFAEIMGDGDELEAVNRFLAGTQKAVTVVYGSHDDGLAICIPVGGAVAYPGPKDGDGLAEALNTIEAQDAGVNSDPDATIVKVPDFAITLT